MFKDIVSPSEIIEMLKSQPDRMMVCSKFIAVYDSELDTTVMIPGRFERMSLTAAQEMLNLNLATLKE